MRRSIARLLCAVSAATACSAGGDGGTDPVPAGTISVSLSQSGGSVVQNGSGTVNATLTRGGGFTGTVNLTVEGAPAGVTGVVSSVVTSGTTTTALITFQVGATVAPGVYNLTVRGTATGLTATTAAFDLTVTPAVGYTLALTSNALSIAAGTNGSTNLNLTRTAFTGDVTFSATGMPTGMTVLFVTNPVSGTSTQVRVFVDAAVPTGVSTLTLRGAAAGLSDQTIPLTVTVTPVPSVALAVTNLAASTGQGTVITATVTATRTNYTGSITFRTSGLSGGVTATFNPASTTGNTSTMTLTIPADATVGQMSGFVNADGDGIQPASGAFQFTITGQAITLALSNQGVLVQQNGASANTTLTITRNQFTGTVTITTENVPNGLTVTPNPASTTGNSSVITVSATAAVAPGNYNVTIRATPINAAPPALRAGGTRAVRGGGARPAVANPEDITLSVTVQTAAGGNTLAVVDFTGCSAEQRPIWFANQDGANSFQVNPGISPHVYQFNVTLGKGAIAYVLQGTGGNTQLVIQGMSQAEWTAAGSRIFCSAPSGRTVTGTLAGLGATDLGHASLGNASATALQALPGFTLNNVFAGTHDFVAYSHLQNGVAGTDRMGIRRDVGGAVTSVGTFNMLTDPDAFAPLNALITIGGPLVGNEVIAHAMTYFTGASCTGGFLYFGMPVSGNTFTAYGAPVAKQRSGDRHEVSISVQNTATDFRTVQEFYHDFGPRTVTLPTRVSSVGVVEHIPGTGINYKRLRLGISRPADLMSSLVFQYSQSGAKALTWTMTSGWLGPDNFADIVVADFHAKSGWNDAWLPSVASTVQWTASLTGNDLSSGICSQASGRQASATVIGTH